MTDAPRPSALSIWVHAARPNTLPAAAAGVVVGLGAALATGAAPAWLVEHPLPPDSHFRLFELR